MSAAIKKGSKGIRCWPEDERPRQRLLSRGRQDLTDAEVIAILLRVGIRGRSAMELGRELLKRFASVQAMMRAPLAARQGIKGLGTAKVAQLQAGLELGRRAALPQKRGRDADFVGLHDPRAGLQRDKVVANYVLC